MDSKLPFTEQEAQLPRKQCPSFGRALQLVRLMSGPGAQLLPLALSTGLSIYVFLIFSSFPDQSFTLHQVLESSWLCSDGLGLGCLLRPEENLATVTIEVFIVGGDCRLHPSCFCGHGARLGFSPIFLDLLHLADVPLTGGSTCYSLFSRLMSW